MTAHQTEDRRIAEVVQLERELLRPEVRGQKDRIEELLHPDFLEFGASGTVWTAQAIAQHLASHEDLTGEPLQMAEPTATVLGPDSILLAYRATSDDRHSLRSSVWIRHEGTWRMLFHQGTRCTTQSTSS